MRALQISAYGDPLNVLELVDIPEPGVPGAGEVLIDVELAPLNLHDLLFIRGYFGGPPAPTVVGNEGFGRIAGNSGLSRSLSAIAKQRGIQTISFVRRPELIDELKAAGADVVLLNEP